MEVLLIKANVSIAKKVSLLPYFSLYMSVNKAPAGVWRPVYLSRNESDSHYVMGVESEPYYVPHLGPALYSAHQPIV